jgi:hypothetical protein
MKFGRLKSPVSIGRDRLASRVSRDSRDNFTDGVGNN